MRTEFVVDVSEKKAMLEASSSEPSGFGGTSPRGEVRLGEKKKHAKSGTSY
jgi:hypothetical protein